MVEVGLPAAVRGAAGPLGRMVVGVRRGRGRREEVVGEDGGGPLATDYRRHGAPRLLLLLVLLALPLAADAVLLPASAAHPLPSPPPIRRRRRVPSSRWDWVGLVGGFGLEAEADRGGGGGGGARDGLTTVTWTDRAVPH